MTNDRIKDSSPMRTLRLSMMHLGTLGALSLFAILIISLNISAGLLLKDARIDLTQRQLYTLTPGTLHLLSDLQNPITLRFFFSKRRAAAYPSLLTQGSRVADMLRAMARIAGEKIQLEIIDPQTFSTEEDLALAYEMRGIDAGEEVLYFGLSGVNLTGGQETIPFFTAEREDYLEYDIVRLIDALQHIEKPRLGLVSSLPFDTGVGGLPAALQGKARPFALYDALIRRFDVVFLEQKFRRVPAKIRVLMVAHTKPLSEETLYALDQFVMRGGRLVIFVDPYSELSRVTSNGELLRGAQISSDLKRLFDHWGILYSDKDIVVDRRLAMQVAIGEPPQQRLIDYPLWLSLHAEDLQTEDAIIASLDKINLASVGRLRARKEREAFFHPILKSSEDSMVIAKETILEDANPQRILDDFKADPARHILAGRLSGPLTSAFAKPPPQTDQEPLPRHIQETEAAHMVIFADSDIFDDRFWVIRNPLPTGEVQQPIADNGKVVLNAIDSMMGNDALIGLRARERARRPFLHIEALREKAQSRFLLEARALENHIAAIEQDLAQSQKSAEEMGADLRQTLLESRRALREVRRKEREEIEALSGFLTFMNIFSMPLLASATALLIAFWRRRQRRFS